MNLPQLRFHSFGNSRPIEDFAILLSLGPPSYRARRGCGSLSGQGKAPGRRGAVIPIEPTQGQPRAARRGNLSAMAPSQRPVILCLTKMHEAGISLLREASELRMASGVDPETLGREIVGADGLIIRTGGTVDAA